MLCKDAEELIKNYRVGSITADNFLLLIQHTKECPKCHALFEKAESALEKGETGTFGSRVKSIYFQTMEKIKKKQEQKKVYTRKSFYISLILALAALTVTGIVKGMSFNNFFLFFGAFMITSAVLIFFMLFMIE